MTLIAERVNAYSMNLKKSLKALFLISQIHMQRRCLHRSKTHSIRKV